MAGESTKTTISNIVQTAYDTYLEFALRAMPLVRALVDKYPVEQAMPGSSVKLSIHDDMAPATTPLVEITDPTPVTIGNPTQVTLNFDEYGNTTKTTAQARNYAFSELEPAIMNKVTWNVLDTLDILALTVLRAGTNVLYGNAATFDTTGPTNTITGAADVLKAQHVLYVVAKMRGANVQPRKDDLFWGGVHPDASYDLRTETGATGWLLPHQYSAPEAIWKGEIGAFGGAFFVETPRMYQALDGTASAKVSRSLFAGKQALAEGVGHGPEIVVADDLDSLRRFKYVGWKGIFAWAIYRQAALWRVESSSSF